MGFRLRINVLFLVVSVVYKDWRGREEDGEGKRIERKKEGNRTKGKKERRKAERQKDDEENSGRKWRFGHR